MSNDRPASLTPPPAGYASWLADVKTRIHQAQQRAARAVNQELVGLYWHIGHDIAARQQRAGWGAKVIERLSHDLRTAFPEMQGFSPRNLKYMRAFAEAWPEVEFVQQVVAQLPWGHVCVLIDRLDSLEARNWYVAQAVQHGWSRRVLGTQLDTKARERSGKAISNFDLHLPKPQSDLAKESLKDPYRLDFLGLGAEAHEREIESALVRHVTEFLLELGAGFAFVGRQVHVEVGGEDFFIDLLFYHLKLRCYVVVELKADKFKPEHIGQLGFYLTAVDRQVKSEHDGKTIGLLLCKNKNQVVAEYALQDSTKPMGVAEYQLIESLPENLQTGLPSIAQIERELAGDEAENA
jgi:predicted nuclease of restriction endonuclease-like (RecB) superfamily